MVSSKDGNFLFAAEPDSSHNQGIVDQSSRALKTGDTRMAKKKKKKAASKKKKVTKKAKKAAKPKKAAKKKTAKKKTAKKAAKKAAPKKAAPAMTEMHDSETMEHGHEHDAEHDMMNEDTDHAEETGTSQDEFGKEEPEFENLDDDDDYGNPSSDEEEGGDDEGYF